MDLKPYEGREITTDNFNFRSKADSSESENYCHSISGQWWTALRVARLWSIAIASLNCTFVVVVVVVGLNLVFIRTPHQLWPLSLLSSMFVSLQQMLLLLLCEASALSTVHYKKLWAEATSKGLIYSHNAWMARHARDEWNITSKVMRHGVAFLAMVTIRWSIDGGFRFQPADSPTERNYE